MKNEVMTTDDFSLLRDLVHREFGIVLKGDKRLTLHARLSHRLRILGLGTYREYCRYVTSDPSKEELYALASHITNNETYFFRERPQLDAFSNLLKEVKREKQRRNQQCLRILSVPSSSGEEAYTLNIVLQESGLFLWGWDIAITGIDVDRKSITKAREACYSENSFRSLNGNAGTIKRKYFISEENRYAVRTSYRKNVAFRHGNILDRSAFDDLAPADIIFCRNMLIYMSDEAIGKVARNFYHCLDDAGYLFVGSSESLIQKTNLFQTMYVDGIVVYRKNVRGEDGRP